MSTNPKFITVEQHEKQVKQAEIQKRKAERELIKLEKQRIKDEKEALKQQTIGLKVKSKKQKDTSNNENIDGQLLEQINDIVLNNKITTVKPQIIDDMETITSKLSLMINVDNKVSNYEPKYEILKDDGRIIKKIIHIADIHIRLSTLHDEYNEVFERLYNELRIIKDTQPDTLICLCGDLLHSKDELKPNTIIHTWNFIKNLSDIFPLIIITGNHDTIELNNNKIDSITAILKDRPINNTYYLINSGVYIYNNVVFGVSSIIDKFTLSRNIVSSVLESNKWIDNDHKYINFVKYIGLYHGSVDGCIINEYGTKLRGTKKLSDFACPISGLTYDYILLGDIHKFQYLDKNKTAAYSSSLISQNFTEVDDLHGFLEWNILDGTSIYHKIHNNYAYHKINISQLYNVQNINDITSIVFDEQNIHLCFKNINSGFFRIEFDEVLTTKINRESLKNQIIALYPNITISWQIIFNKYPDEVLSQHIPLDDQTSITENIKPSNSYNEYNVLVNLDKNNDQSQVHSIIGSLQSLNHHNQENINNLIKRYMKINFYGITDNMIEKVLEYLNKIIIETKSKSLENDIEYINSDWNIIWLSFDNMYGYGPNNVIDFTKYPMNEIVGIFGENAIGKSSIIDIITYMLYSRSARDEASSNPKDIVNVSTSKASGILVIESNNIKYLIKRIANRIYHATSGKYNLKTNLFTYKMIETTDITLKDTFKLHDKLYILQSLTEENRLCTDDILVPIIGTYDNFITTSILLQGNHKSFKNKTNAQKKDFLCEILKIDYFKKCESFINEKYKALKVQSNTLKQIYNSFNNTKSINDLNIDLLNIDALLLQLDSSLITLENTLNSKYDEIQLLSSSIININIDNLIYNIDIINETNKLTNYDTLISQNIIKLSSLNQDIEHIKSLISNLDLDPISNNIIIQKYEEHNNNFKNKKDCIMNQINVLFDEKQSFVLNKIDKTLTIDHLNELIKNTTNNISELNNMKSNITKIYDEINNLISVMHLIESDIVINNDEELHTQQNNMNELNLSLNKNKDVHKYIVNNIDNINNKINSLTLIKYRDIIIKEYNDCINMKKNKQTKITDDINNIISKQKHTLIFIDNNIKLDELLSEQIEILSLLANNNQLIRHLYNQYNDFLIVDDNENININQSYVSTLNNEMNLLKQQFDELHMELYKHTFIKYYNSDSYDLMIKDKLYLTDYFKNDNTIYYVNNKERITSEYNKMMVDNKSLIYDSLNEIKDGINKCINDASYDKSLLNKLTHNIDLVRCSLNFVFNISDDVNIIVNKYNELVQFETYYNINLQQFNYIQHDIIVYKTIERLNKKIEYIKKQINNIDNIKNMISYISQLLETYERINNELTFELDEIQNNILIINSNNEKQEQINKNNKKIADLKYEHDNLKYYTKQNYGNLYGSNDVEYIYNMYNEQQLLFMNLNDELIMSTIKLNESNANIKNLEDKTNDINNNINIYMSYKHMIEHNGKIQDIIENLYDNVDLLKKNYNIDINDVNDIKLLLEQISIDILNNNKINEDAYNKIEIICQNKDIIENMNIIDTKINILKSELDIINDPNNEHILNFHMLQDKLLLNSKYNSNINILSGELNEVSTLIHKYKLEHSIISNNIRLYNESKTHMDHNMGVNKNINLLKDDIKQINSEIKEITNKSILNKNARDNLIKTISNVEKINKELDVITFDTTIYEFLSKLTSRDGVQLFLLKESLQNITNKVNNILEPFINKTINMALNGDTIELSIISKDGNIIHTISGMESFMLDLVFKIIIGQISVIPKSNLIFMDESISVLDAGRMSSIEELFAFLRQYYNTIFLITHMKQVNNHINHSLDIVRHNGNSLIFNITPFSLNNNLQLQQQLQPDGILSIDGNVPMFDSRILEENQNVIDSKQIVSKMKSKRKNTRNFASRTPHIVNID